MTVAEILSRDGWMIKFSGTDKDMDFLFNKALGITEAGNSEALVVVTNPGTYALVTRKVER